jgi:iron(III) transport system substrate-binding protein
MEDRGWRRRVGAILHPLSSILVFVLIIGCDRRDKSDTSASKTVVVYTSVDEPVARPILDEFQKRTGITVSVQTDTEANKSAGLAARLLAERDRPRVDVWWGNEVFHTVNLADAGALAPYESPSARDIPDTFKDPKHRWAGSGMRARVIAVRAQASSSPKGFRNLTGLEGLTDP